MGFNAVKMCESHKVIKSSAGSNGALGDIKFWRPPEYWCSGQLVESFVRILVRLFVEFFFLKITVLCIYFILIIFALAPP